MSTLRSALDELEVQDLRFLGDEQIASDLDELELATRRIEAQRARRVAEIERRGAFATDGHVSATAWLADRHLVAHSVAAGQVRLARALEHMPATARALSQGEVSTSAVRLLVQARQGCEDAFVEAEEMLVEAARSLPVDGLRHATSYWRQAADPLAAAEDEERRFERRGLHISATIDGMGRIDGDLDPEGTQVLLTALRAQVDADVLGGRDLRTSPQRRADALVEICRSFLDRADRPRVGGERPHVVVLMDVETLERRPGRRCELADTGPITPETARRWACDANVSRVITDARSVPLELGRRTRVVPAALRRALIVRDRTCAFPGCDRPPSWCDAHHIRHWADGGDTSLHNLVLLCRRHHRVVHTRGFGIEMRDGVALFSRPDGTELAGRPAGGGALADRAPP